MMDTYALGLAVIGALIALGSLVAGYGVGFLHAMSRYRIDLPKRPDRR